MSVRKVALAAALVSVTGLSGCMVDNAVYGPAAIQMVRPMQAPTSVGDALSVGKTYRDSLPVGLDGVVVPLPEGDWVLSAWNVERKVLDPGRFLPYLDTPASYLFQGQLVQISGNTVGRAISFELFVNDGAGFTEYKPWCGAEKAYYVRPEISTAGLKEDCWGVNDYHLEVAGQILDRVTEAPEFRVRDKVSAIFNTMAVMYRKVDGRKTLIVNYHFNLDVAGTVPATTEGAAEPATTRVRVYQDAGKLAAIKALEGWAQSWKGRLDDGFPVEQNNRGV